MSLIAGNLAVVQQVLDSLNIGWGVCAGAAAHLYGQRRPINDVDILVAPGTLTQISTALQRGQKAVQFDGGRILWRGIKLFDDVSVRQGSTVYPFALDAAMQARLQRKPLLGSKVNVLAPEDILVQKLLLNRGETEGKFDIADADGMIKRQTFDLDYLRERLAATRALELLRPRLAERGVEV